MGLPFRLNVRPDTFSYLVEQLRSTVERFPDERTGSETVYSMADAALGAFSAFFTQSSSFLDFQRTLRVAKGCNNALTLFGITQIPSDKQIRNLLDPVPPGAVLPVFAAVVGPIDPGRLDTATIRGLAFVFRNRGYGRIVSSAPGIQAKSRSNMPNPTRSGFHLPSVRPLLSGYVTHSPRCDDLDS